MKTKKTVKTKTKENKKLDEVLKKLQAREQELTIINKVHERLASKKNIQSIYDLVGNKIKEIFDAQAVTIVSFDHKKKLEYFNYVIEKGKRFYLDPRPIDKLRKELIKNRKTILIKKITSEVQKKYGFKKAPGTEFAKSLLFVPLTAAKKVTGYISLQNVDKENAFSKSDVQLLSTLAHSMSAALENARLFDETNRLLSETQQRNAELAIINSVGEAMSRNLDVETVTKIVGDKVKDIFNAEATEILLLDKKSNMITVPFSYYKGYQKVEPFSLGEGMTSRIISSRKPFIAGTHEEQSSFGAISDESLGEVDLTESYMGVPIIAGKKVLGVVSVQSYKKNAFDENSLRLLSTLSTSMGVAIENARLFDETNKLLNETQQRNAELAVINKVQEGLVAKMDIQAIYDLVGEEIREIFDAQVVSIGSYDYENQLCHFKYDIEKGKRFYEEPRKFTAIDNYLIENQKIILINENIIGGLKALGEDPNPAAGTEMPKSAVWVPLIVAKKVRGHVSLQNIDKEKAFGESDVRLLTTLANSMSVALENARLFDETNRLLEATKQQAAELTIINTVGEGLAQKLDYQAIIDLVGDKVREIFNAQIVTISSYNKKEKTIHHLFVNQDEKRFYFDSPSEIDPDRKEIIETKKPLVFGTTQEIINHSGEGLLAGDMPKSYMGVPIILNKEATGVITVQDVNKENLYKESDVRLLMTLASNMGVALENARLFEETTLLLEATKQQAAELTIINTVGEGLAQKLDYQAIIDLVGDKIVEIFDAQIVTISPYSKKENTIHHRYVFESNKRFYFDSPQEIDPDRKEIIITKKSLVFGTSQEIINHSGEGVLAGDMPKSFMGVPIILNREVKGVITVQDLNREHLYKESDVRLLMTLASNMGVALENARLFEETTRLLDETTQRNAELAIINSVGEAMAKKLDLKTVTHIVGDKVKDIFNAEAVEILLLDDASNMINIPYSFYNGYQDAEPITLGEGLTSHIIKTRQPLVFRSTDEQDKFGAIYDEVDKTESYMGVPIIVGEKVLGVVSVQSYKKNAYDNSNVRLLSTLSTNMGVALENARLFEETTRLLNETTQRNAELGVINSVQEGLVAKMDMQAIYDLVGNKIHNIFDAQVVVIRTFDQRKNFVNFNYVIEKEQRFYVDPQQPDDFMKHLIENRKPVLINNNYTDYVSAFGSQGAVKGELPKSAVFVPMIVGEEVKGNVSLQNVDRENVFTESDVRLLTTLANSMSVAIENARLFNETQQRNAELSILNAIQRGLVMEMNFEGIIELVGDKLREAMDFQDIGIRLYDKEKDMIIYPYEYEHGERLYLAPMKPTVTSRYVLVNKKMLLLKKNNNEEIKKLGIQGVATIPGTDRSKSVIAVPILVGDEARGLIIIENYEKEDAFSESDIRLLTTLSNSMSVALENARLFNETVRLLEETKQRAAELSTVNSISKAIAAHLELDKLINLVGERIRELFKANMTYVALYNKEDKVINFPYGYGDEFPPLKLGEGLTSQVIKTGEPLLINKEISALTAELGIERRGLPATSYLAVPIPVGDEIIGVISVQSTEQENRFSEEDMRLLNTIAANVGVAINNAEAYRQLNLTVDQLNSTLKDLKSTQQQLIISEKLASLGQLTAGIAHEIKNPLNFVNNFAEVSIELIEELKTELNNIKTNLDQDKSKNIEEILKDLEENSQRINQHGKRADSIVRSMLQHSRGKAGERQDSDINAMLEEDLNLAYHGMRARDTSFNITIEKDFDKNLDKISVVPQDVSRVFLNIINNGFYETGKKKKNIQGNFSPTIKVSTKNLKDKIEVRIRDNGNGIPIEARDKLFNPFFTTKPTGEGTGLGLSLSHDIIVKQHNGEIKFETESGEFTEFIISLPKDEIL